MPSANHNGTTPLAVFGAMLRHYRIRAGLSLDELGSRVFLTGNMLGKIENGLRAPSAEFIADCEKVPELASNGALLELREVLKDHLRDRAYPGWFADWPGKEAGAKRLRTFELVVVPGLLQTEDYARAVLSTRVGDSDDEIEEMVAARMERQAILARPKPPTLWVILDEAVLRRPVGGPEVMAGQLRRLAEDARKPDIVLQVVPFGAGAHQGLNGGAFVIADFDAGPGAAYQDAAAAGQVVDNAEEIESLMVTWDTLRAEALPRSASLKLVEEAERQWT